MKFRVLNVFLKWRSDLPIIHQMNSEGQDRQEKRPQYSHFYESHQRKSQGKKDVQQGSPEEKDLLFKNMVAQIKKRQQVRAQLLLKHEEIKLKLKKQEVRLEEIKLERQKQQRKLLKLEIQRKRMRARTQAITTISRMNIQHLKLEDLEKFLRNQGTFAMEDHKDENQGSEESNLNSVSKEKKIKKAGPPKRYKLYLHETEL